MKKIKNSLQAMGALLALSLLATPVSGAPITFAFEAEIGIIFSGIPFDSGIDFEVGDVILGQFTFDPSEGDGTNPFTKEQTRDFSLNINGTVLTAPKYQIRSWNDNAITDFPPSSVVDDLFVSGASLSPENRLLIPAMNPAQSFFRMSLLGNSDLLPNARHPESVAIWNAFGFERQITVRLRDIKGGSVAFQATVGPFVAVPEPSTAGFIVSAFLAVISFRFLNPASMKRFKS